MTDAAAINILSLSAGAQDQLLRQYFSPEGTLSQSQVKVKVTLLSIFQFVCTDREIEIPTISHNPEYKNTNIYKNMYILYIHNQQTHLYICTH